MSDYVIDPPPLPSLPISGRAERFPLRRVFCVGRNYAAHVREMGNDLREPPFFFDKPADAVVESGAELPYPQATADLHHEVELVVAIGRGGSGIAAEAALSHIWGACVGVDLTRRDLQADAKAKGRPWDMAKGFDRSAPMAALVPLADAGPLDAGRIWLSVDGAMKQDADLSEMIWPVADCIAHLSSLVELAPGDLIMTGTPAGVGPLAPGAQVRAGIGNLPELDFRIAP
ncbi:MAG: fumarylacetoacetate hydrolase family protein [Litoreibacter sp.]|nr:fumarylacetoacetate hydrolase family protein [Litoreibacter sp.]